MNVWVAGKTVRSFTMCALPEHFLGDVLTERQYISYLYLYPTTAAAATATVIAAVAATTTTTTTTTTITTTVNVCRVSNADSVDDVCQYGSVTRQVLQENVAQ